MSRCTASRGTSRPRRARCPSRRPTAWPYRATLTVGANRITAEGRLGDPVGLTAAVPEPAALRPLVVALAPGVALPAALPPLDAALRVGPGMALSDLGLTIGALDLDAHLPGLVLTRLVARAPSRGRGGGDHHRGPAGRPGGARRG